MSLLEGITSRDVLQFSFAGAVSISLYLVTQAWLRWISRPSSASSRPSSPSHSARKGGDLPRQPTFFANLVNLGNRRPAAAAAAAAAAAGGKGSWELPKRERVAGEAELVRLMLPDDANPAGNVHGGTMLKLIEQVGWIVASRHANSGEQHGLLGVTARLEQMDFHEPVFIGEIVTLRAKLAFVSAHSMMVVVKASAENAINHTSRHTNTAILWYVALDPNDPTKVAEVPPFVPKTPEEQEMFNRGKAMYDKRKKLEQEKRAQAESQEREVEDNNDELNPDRYPKDPNGFTPRQSHSELVQLMLPSDCTEKGIVQGGVIMKLMDNAAGCVAFRHCMTNVVTVSLEAMDIKAPVYNGNLVFVNATLTFVSQKSLEIEVIVEAENMMTGTRAVTNTAYFKFVSLDANRKTANVRPLVLETREDVRRFLIGKKRYEEAKNERRKQGAQ